MTENTPGYHVPEYPFQRKIITLDVLNMEILQLRREQEQMKELMLCQKKMIEALSKKIDDLDGWSVN